MDLSEALLERLDLAIPFNFWPFRGSKVVATCEEILEGLNKEIEYLCP